MSEALRTTSGTEEASWTWVAFMWSVWREGHKTSAPGIWLAKPSRKPRPPQRVSPAARLVSLLASEGHVSQASFKLTHPAALQTSETPSKTTVNIVSFAKLGPGWITGGPRWETAWHTDSRFGVRLTQNQILAQPLTNSGTLSKFLDLPEPHFPCYSELKRFLFY